MKTRLALSILLLQATVTFGQPHWDYSADSLSVVWGAQRYLGKQDCSAKVRLGSTDTNIIVEVEVSDDKLVLSDDPINSDHIELWFALRNVYKDYPGDDYYEPDNVTSYLSGNTFYLYLYKGKSDLAAFRKEIKNPKIDAFDAGEKNLSYNRLSDNDIWLKLSIDSYLADARQASLKKCPMFYGLVHLGIFPKSGHAVMYDKDAYDILQKQTNISVPDYSSYLKVDSHIEEQGYRVRIVIPPQALGFVKNTGITDALFLIDIVDCDSSKQKSLLSTSPTRIWGDPASFNKVGFVNEVKVPLFKKFKEFGTTIDNEAVGAQLRRFLSEVFVYTTEGWTPIDRECSSFYQYDQPASYQLPNIQKCLFKRGILNFKEQQFGKNMLGYLATSSGELLILGDTLIYPTENILETFRLPDSSAGFITTEFDVTGRYNKFLDSKLFLLTASDKTLLATYLSGPTQIVFTNSLKVRLEDSGEKLNDWWTGEDTNGDWRLLYKLIETGQSIIFDLGGGHLVKAWWDENGDNVQFIKM